MARNLIWADLNAETLASMHNPQPKAGFSARSQLAKAMGLADPQNPRQAILLDLFVHALAFGQSLQLADDKLSGLVSIMKAVHTKATQSRLPIERSFTHFKDLLLQHSVQRPPISVGLFTLEEFKAILAWGLDTYFRHYKLYQYAFTDRVVMSVVQQHPSDGVDLLPPGFLQPLQAAMTQEEHRAVVAQQEQHQDAKAKEAAEQSAADAEAQRLALLREQYEVAVPDEIRDRVQAAVDKEVLLLRQAMDEQLAVQQATLMAKIVQLEARVL